MSSIKQQLLDAIDRVPDPILEQLFSLLQILTQSHAPSPQAHSPFGVLRDSGEILGDIVAPVVPSEEWDVFQ